MSLIMDALKKAQQLRLKEPKGTPLPSSPLPANKKSLRGLGKQWIVIGVGLFSLIIFFLIFWRLFSPPSTSIPIRTADRIEKKPPAPIEDKKPQVPSKGTLSPSKDTISPQLIEGSKDILSSSKDAPRVLKETASLSKEAPSMSKDVLSPPKDKEPLPTGQAGAEGLPYVGATLSGRPSSPRGEKESPEPKPSIKEKREAPPIKQMVAEQKVKKTIPPLPPASLKEKAPVKSIEVKPESEKDRPLSSEVLTHFNLGVQLYNQREFLKAIQSYQKVIELDSTYVEAYNNLGIIYQEMGDVDRAFGAYQKSIEINPRYEKGYNNLGIILYLKGHNEEAVEAFQKALTINSNNIESHINLGVLFKKQGQLNKAIESYQKAIEINPLHKEIHYNIALLYEQLENVELAIRHYQQFIKLSSPSYSELVSRVQRHMEYLMKTKGNRK
jgi:Flp pilus assembly protein TadD